MKITIRPTPTHKKNIQHSIIVFCYLFRFIILKDTFMEKIIDSSFLVFAYLILKSFVNKQYRSSVERNFRSSYVQKVLIIYSEIFFVTLMICFRVAVSSYLDMGFIKTWVLLGIQLIIGVYVYSYIKMEKGDTLNILINVYILQACIQLISFLFPKVWRLLNCFRTNDVIERSGSIRGMSLDRYDYFNLACGYCLLYVILVFRWNKWRTRSYWIKLIGLLLLIYGGLASARTCMVIMGFSCGAYVIKKIICKSKRVRLKRVFITVIFIFIVFVLTSMLLKQYAPAQAMFEFLFIHLIYFFQYHELTNPSTQQLFVDMYFPIQSLKTWLIGDGHFLSETGGYYKFTDAGYMRLILYGGLFIGALLLVFQIQLLDNKLKGKASRMESIFVMIMILILNIKGIVLGCQVLIIPMLFLLSLEDRNKAFGVWICKGEKNG